MRVKMNQRGSGGIKGDNAMRLICSVVFCRMDAVWLGIRGPGVMLQRGKRGIRCAFVSIRIRTAPHYCTGTKAERVDGPCIRILARSPLRNSPP